MSSTTTGLAAEDAKKPKEKFAIVVNGESSIVDDELVSFEQVVTIAFPVDPSPDTTYTVTFGNAKGRRHEGELVQGQSITVKKKGTTFDVSPTGKS
ncbi:multiubiquitin domain-containing protein [Salinibacterium sp.]|uniref:multiubiquitin domain-containing protein n=1 Tax=Salinibacterium sp. TaxID=1915057 RepID=UPI00286B2AD7|nr:multiubiquitin domain-containing protein [Salinibacterium sp.]